MLHSRQLPGCSDHQQHHLQRSSAVLARAHTSPALTSQCSWSIRAASAVCRDAPRPMWAARKPVDTPKMTGGAMARVITSEIARSQNVIELSDIYNEWGGSFDYIHAAAALVKCGKLPGGGRSSLVDKLCSKWLSQLPLSGLQGCANVLWACVRLGPGAVEQLWGPTWELYIQCVQRESAVEGACPAQDLSQVLWACAKLRKQPAVAELQLLLHTFLQPAVLADARPQALANVVWALGELCGLAGWQGSVTEQEVQQLLGQQQLQVLAASDKGQDTTNVLVGLAKMVAAAAPVVSVGFARDRGQQLLALACVRLGSWNSQHITNAMWACGELGLADTPFIPAAVAAAQRWVPRSTWFDLNQAATACAALGYKDAAFMGMLLQQGMCMLERRPVQRQGSGKPLSPADRDSLAAILCRCVARLDMQSLASTGVELVSCSGIVQRPSTHRSNLARLWVFHSWLLQHQLLDGKGLAGLLTEQQLRQGAKDAKAFGMC